MNANSKHWTLQMMDERNTMRMRALDRKLNRIGAHAAAILVDVEIAILNLKLGKRV